MNSRNFIRHLRESKATSLDRFAQQVTAKYGIVFILTQYDPQTIKLESIIVKDKKQGTGTAVMQELTEYADQHHMRIILTPGVQDDRHGTTSRSRLIKFYKRFGFYENKGRHKDFSLPSGMIRDAR